MRHKRDISSYFIPSLQDKVMPNMSNRLRGNPRLLSLPTLDWNSVEDVSAICFNNRGMVEIDMPGSHNIKIWRQAFYGCNSVQRILNFFNNRATNAAAESFNAKLKAFRAQFRGVRDLKFFLYRVANIYA